MINSFFSSGRACFNGIFDTCGRIYTEAASFIDEQIVRRLNDNAKLIGNVAMGVGISACALEIKAGLSGNLFYPASICAGLALTYLGYKIVSQEKEATIPSEAFQFLKHPDTKEALLVTWPYSDYNDAFSLQCEVRHKENLQRLNQKYLIEVITPDSKDSIIKACKDILKKQLKFKGVIIAGHGTTTSVKYTKSFLLEKDKVTRDYFPGLDPNSVFIFISCNTGALGGIAERISQLFPNSLIYAPENEAYTNYSYFYLDNAGEPAACYFDYLNQTMITRIIANGSSLFIPPAHADMIEDKHLKKLFNQAVEQRVEMAWRQIEAYRAYIYSAARRERTAEASQRVIDFENEIPDSIEGTSANV